MMSTAQIPIVDAEDGDSRVDFVSQGASFMYEAEQFWQIPILKISNFFKKWQKTDSDKFQSWQIPISPEVGRWLSGIQYGRW